MDLILIDISRTEVHVLDSSLNLVAKAFRRADKKNWYIMQPGQATGERCGPWIADATGKKQIVKAVQEILH